MVHVLMVCLGNICRSPMAEALFNKMVNEAGLSDQISVDSAGTGSWHIGQPAHAGTRRVLQKHGISYRGSARQLEQADMTNDVDYIIGMDASNMKDIVRRYGEHPKLYRLLDFATNSHEKNVPDPYYSGNFEQVYQLVEDGCRGLLDFVKKDAGIKKV